MLFMMALPTNWQSFYKINFLAVHFDPSAQFCPGKSHSTSLVARHPVGPPG
jgi:hypothetical protein